jgi:molybdopterin converting factor small subunit
MITVSFHSILRIEIACSEVKLDQADISVFTALRQCEKVIGRPFLDTLLESSKGLHRSMILLNGTHISLLQGFDTIIPANAHLTVLPLVGGG